jgi:hypothetical protein
MISPPLTRERCVQCVRRREWLRARVSAREAEGEKGPPPRQLRKALQTKRSSALPDHSDKIACYDLGGLVDLLHVVADIGGGVLEGREVGVVRRTSSGTRAGRKLIVGIVVDRQAELDHLVDARGVRLGLLE